MTLCRGQRNCSPMPARRCAKPNPCLRCYSTRSKVGPLPLPFQTACRCSENMCGEAGVMCIEPWLWWWLWRWQGSR